MRTVFLTAPTPPSRLHRLLTWCLMTTMLASLALLTAPFWPGAAYSLHAVWSPVDSTAGAAADMVQPPGPGNWLLISKIGVKTPIVDGPDIGVLDRQTGVWHQVGSIDQGNFVIAGHRFKYLPPNQTTLYNLDKLREGDTITLWWQGRHHSFRVTRLDTVGRDATEILNPSAHPQLTVYTCTDLAASHRLVVTAVPTAT